MPISLLDPLRDVPLTFVDVETTGGSVRWGDRIMEVGLARVEGGHIVEQHSWLIDPRRPISPGVVALTGITQSLVEAEPRFAERITEILAPMVSSIVVGHNVHFDLAFLDAEFGRCGTSLASELGRTHVLDTLVLARRRYGRGGNGLESLARRFGIMPIASHRALADVLTTIAVFEKLIEPLGGYDVQLANLLAAQGRAPRIRASKARGGTLLSTELEEALEEREPVELEYVDSGRSVTTRVISPHRVARRGRSLVLIAHCHTRKAQRTFRVDRIVRVRRLAEDNPEISQSASPGERA